MLFSNVMKSNIRYFNFVVAVLTVLLLGSCHTMKRISPTPEVSVFDAFGLKIDKNDTPSLYREVASWIGTPYKYGGNTRSGIDCSGLVSYIYNSVYGISLDRMSEAIYRQCKPVSKKHLEEGDLVFFSTGKKHRINHVGIYLKNGYFVHSSTSKGVIISHLQEPYYIARWRGGGKIRK